MSLKNKPYLLSFRSLLCNTSKACLLLLLQILNSNLISAQTNDNVEDTVVSKPIVKHEIKFDFYRIGLDVSKIAASIAQSKYKLIEAQFDVHYKQDIYFAFEFGLGNSIVDNDYLHYKSNNSFIRLGIDKTFFSKNFNGDFDNAFVGLRYGLGFIKRTNGTYTIDDIIWGNSSGTIESASFAAHWLELTGGFRLEVLKNIFAGWNVRMKTLANPKKFELLPPAYIAGYGKGDRNTAFGYNFYILYGFGKRY